MLASRDRRAIHFQDEQGQSWGLWRVLWERQLNFTRGTLSNSLFIMQNANTKHKKEKDNFSEHKLKSNRERETEESNQMGIERGSEQKERGSLLKKVSRGSGCSISAPCWLWVWVSAGTGLWLASVWGMWSTWFIFKLLSSFTKRKMRIINGDEKSLFMNKHFTEILLKATWNKNSEYHRESELGFLT